MPFLYRISFYQANFFVFFIDFLKNYYLKKKYNVMITIVITVHVSQFGSQELRPMSQREAAADVPPLTRPMIDRQTTQAPVGIAKDHSYSPITAEHVSKNYIFQSFSKTYFFLDFYYFLIFFGFFCFFLECSRKPEIKITK